MKIKKVHSSCLIGSCPTIAILDGEKRVIIIGKYLQPSDLPDELKSKLGSGEVAISFPSKLIADITDDFK